MKGLCILGSTGSIGRNTLKVIKGLPGRFQVISLSAGRNLALLAEQIVEFRPTLVSVGTADEVAPLREALSKRGFHEAVKIVAGREGRIASVAEPGVDTVVSASHGVTGLIATYEAAKMGKRICLANKETMVVAGEIVTREAKRSGAEVLPVDSEHCAIHQCLRAGESREVERLILTGSGGPFLHTPGAEFESICPEQALNHPVWKMGGRITIDSATLMNKGFEIIEAHWLFGLSPAQIEVVIHPESVIHSMLEFKDRCVLAQLAVADMRIPIQYALTYPERAAADDPTLRLDLISAGSLHFSRPDTNRFPCLSLGREAIQRGGCIPCSLNAADETAVSAFLGKQVSFAAIPRIIENVMSRTPSAHLGSIEDVLACDREARAWAAEAVREEGR